MTSDKLAAVGGFLSACMYNMPGVEYPEYSYRKIPSSAVGTRFAWGLGNEETLVKEEPMPVEPVEILCADCARCSFGDHRDTGDKIKFPPCPKCGETGNMYYADDCTCQDCNRLRGLQHQSVNDKEEPMKVETVNPPEKMRCNRCTATSLGGHDTSRGVFTRLGKRCYQCDTMLTFTVGCPCQDCRRLTALVLGKDRVMLKKIFPEDEALEDSRDELSVDTMELSRIVSSHDKAIKVLKGLDKNNLGVPARRAVAKELGLKYLKMSDMAEDK